MSSKQISYSGCEEVGARQEKKGLSGTLSNRRTLEDLDIVKEPLVSFTPEPGDGNHNTLVIDVRS